MIAYFIIIYYNAATGGESNVAVIVAPIVVVVIVVVIVVLISSIITYYYTYWQKRSLAYIPGVEYKDKEDDSDSRDGNEQRSLDQPIELGFSVDSDTNETLEEHNDALPNVTG